MQALIFGMAELVPFCPLTKRLTVYFGWPRVQRRHPGIYQSEHDLSLTNLVLPYFKQALIKHDHVSEIVGLKCGEFPVDIKCL